LPLENLLSQLLLAALGCKSLPRLKTVDDKKAICKCLKAAGGSLGVKDQFLSKIPGACNIKVGFPVSTSVNCDA
jgi:hypothetical protein